MEKEQILRNPVLLKLDLMINGIRLSSSLYKKFSSENYYLTFEGIELELEKGIRVRAPYLDRIALRSPYILDDTMNELLIDGIKIPVKIIKGLSLNQKNTSDNILMSHIACSYGKYLAVMPTPSCGFFGQRLACSFCPADQTKQSRTVHADVDDVLETIREVCRAKKPSIIFLSIEAADSPDGGIGVALQYLSAIHKYFNVMIILEVSPPEDTKWIDTAYGSGADAICFNIDIFDKELFPQFCPGKAINNGRQRYINALRYAAGIFPRGTVLTHLIVGIESLESTITGIEYLASSDIVPILSVFRPIKKSMMKYYKPLSVEELIPVYTAVHCSMRRHKIPSTWTKHMGFAITPAEAKLFNCSNNIKRKLTLMMEQSGIVDNIKTGMLRVRRSLRVKEEI